MARGKCRESPPPPPRGNRPGPRPPPVLPAEALSVPRRGPLAGGPTRTPPPPPPPPLGRGRSQREERPRAVGPRGGVPRGREAWEVRDGSALSAREGRKASGTPPLPSSGRRHRLTLFATLPLSFQALKPQSSAAAQVAPPFPTPLPSSRQTSQLQISRDSSPDRPDPARDGTARARARRGARPRERARVLGLGGVDRVAPSVRLGPVPPSTRHYHAGVRCALFSPEILGRRAGSSPSLFPPPEHQPPTITAKEKLCSRVETISFLHTFSEGPGINFAAQPLHTCVCAVRMVK